MDIEEWKMKNDMQHVYLGAAIGFAIVAPVLGIVDALIGAASAIGIWYIVQFFVQ